MLNWGLISHPVNWLTVMLMVLIAGVFVHFCLKDYTTP